MLKAGGVSCGRHIILHDDFIDGVSALFIFETMTALSAKRQMCGLGDLFACVFSTLREVSQAKVFVFEIMFTTNDLQKNKGLLLGELRMRHFDPWQSV